jgi:hypothetical protein
MKKIQWKALAIAASLFATRTNAQNVSINEDGSAPSPYAILDIKSSTRGLLIPRMTTAVRLNTSVLATGGLLVYDSTLQSFWYYNGASWQHISNGGPGTSIKGITIDSAKDNAGFGPRALLNSTGFGNTGIGSLTLRNNTHSMNTALGSEAMEQGNLGDSNTAVGYFSLPLNAGGGRNVAVGSHSMEDNDQGHGNTAVGVQSLLENKGGSANTAIGFNSLFSGKTGSGNTAIGANTAVSADGFSNATAIGFGAIVNASNKVRIGNSAVTVIEGQVPFTTPSDGRYKFQVREDVKGLDFIMNLRPVTYQFDVQRFDSHEARHTGGMTVVQAAYKEAEAIRRSGFIAQEVEKAANRSGYDFSGIIRPKTEDDHYSLSYESFVVPLVKAVQEQQKLIADLQKQIDELKQLRSR